MAKRRQCATCGAYSSYSASQCSGCGVQWGTSAQPKRDPTLDSLGRSKLCDCGQYASVYGPDGVGRCTPCADRMRFGEKRRDGPGYHAFKLALDRYRATGERCE